MAAHNPPALVIFGPTASGKTALAIALAQAFDGEIINADSRQIYRHMPILNACPTVEEYAQAVHHGFEFVEPSERYSSARWAQMAEEKIAEVRGRGKLPIVVGGTGFYLRVLTEGMDEVPEVGEDVEKLFEGRDVRELHAELSEVDPELAAKLEVGDTQRIVRALSVFKATGKPLSAWQKGGLRGREVRRGFLKLGVMPERGILHQRIAKRWQAMVEAGVLAEVEALRAKGYSLGMPGVQGLGVEAMLDVLDGRIDIAEAIELGVIAHRQYAKRQCTWLRNSYGAERIFERADADDVREYVAKKLAP